MDLSFSPAELAFRDEVRAFFRDALPPELRRKTLEGVPLERDDYVAWQRILNKRGWAVPSWPREWGGTGWTPVQQYIFSEEMQSAPAPQPLPFNVSMIGRVLAEFGAEAQKRTFRPPPANPNDGWCQGFPGPGAGSDLASLRTAARREGDRYVVDGQKTWTTLAQYADWMFCLVRTDPQARKRQEGIWFLLIDMKSKGITVRPIVTIDGGREINEVFLDAVEVPVENRVGEENRGWDYAKFLLGNERSGIARLGLSKARLRRIRELAAAERAGGRPLIEDERFREKLAALEVEIKATEMTQLRAVAAEGRREPGKPDPVSSILKLKGSELQQATTELLLELAGPWILPAESGRGEPGRNEPPIGPEWAAGAAPTYFNWRKISIYGGSNEIQRNIVAKAILGL